MQRKHRQLRERKRERHEHWGSSGFPLVDHLVLSDSGSIFGLIQDPPLCVCISFSQDRFKHKGLWEVDRTYYGLAP